MAKKRSPEFEAIRVAMKRPERRAFCSRRMCWAKGKWPCKWTFFTNWRGFSLGLGHVERLSAGDTAPKSVLQVSLDWRPFGFMIYWRSKRIVWIGDWEWKKSLREG
jgi:hypothetical protein